MKTRTDEQWATFWGAVFMVKIIVIALLLFYDPAYPWDENGVEYRKAEQARQAMEFETELQTRQIQRLADEAEKTREQERYQYRKDRGLSTLFKCAPYEPGC